MRRKTGQVGTGTPWAKFLTSPKVMDYAFLNRSDPPALELALSSTAPSGLLYFTKRYLIDASHAALSASLPFDFVVRYGIPSLGQCRVLRYIARLRGTGFRFVGDLDPMDLTVFRILETGSLDWRSDRRSAVPVSYLGIDDTWLSILERRLTGGGGLSRVLIKMPTVEREHLAAMEASGFQVEKVVGKNCAKLLHDGYKLELEGASNPAIYGPRFPKEVLARLLRAAGSL